MIILKNPILIGLVGFKGLLKMKTTMVADVYYETSLGDNITDKRDTLKKTENQSPSPSSDKDHRRKI